MFAAFGYEVVEEKPGGALARSFLAKDATAEAWITVGRGRAPQAARRLARAMGRLGKLPLEGVVPIRHSGCLEDGRPFVINERQEGETLATLLERTGPLSPDELVLLAIPLCGILERLCARGLEVRRLGPEQVLVGGTRLCPDPLLLAPVLFAKETHGTPGRNRADVVALGHLLREALEGPRRARVERLKATVSVDDVDRPLREVIARALANPRWTSPSRPRFARPKEVADALIDHQPKTLIAGASHRSEPLAAPETEVESGLEREGDVVGRYVLEKRIGEGSMGRVFLARHLELGRRAALKLLRPEHARSPQWVRRFFREAMAVNRIRHPNIVEIFDVVDEPLPGGGRRAYCVLELLDGVSLGELRAAGPVSLSRSLEIVRQVCDALEAAHAAGVIHRDIKPDNLFLVARAGKPDLVKVLDFGVAKLERLGDSPAQSSMEGTIVGTPAYMSPEQASGTVTDARTDVYSLGTVLYELLCGHPPFVGASFGQLVTQIVSHEVPDLPSRTEGGEPIPRGLRKVVMRALAKSPEARPVSMRELSTLLAPFAKASPGVGGRRSIRAWAAGSLGAAAVLACLLVPTSRAPSPSRAWIAAASPHPSAMKHAPIVAAARALTKPESVPVVVERAVPTEAVKTAQEAVDEASKSASTKPPATRRHARRPARAERAHVDPLAL